MSIRTTILNDGAFQATTIAIKDDVVLTKVKFTSKFDQLVADALKIKSSIYDSDGQRRPGLRKLELEILLFGATISISPTQANLFNNTGLTLDSIQIGDAWVRRLRADEALRLSFTVTIAGIPRELFDYIEGVRKNTINITIEPASKEREETARTAAITHGLFAEPKGDGEDDEDEDDSEQEENEVAVEAEAPESIETGTLATARQMGGSKKPKAAGAPVQ